VSRVSAFAIQPGLLPGIITSRALYEMSLMVQFIWKRKEVRKTSKNLLNGVKQALAAAGLMKRLFQKDQSEILMLLKSGLSDSIILIG
jgi:hypothetical protein